MLKAHKFLRANNSLFTIGAVSSLIADIPRTTWDPDPKMSNTRIVTIVRAPIARGVAFTARYFSKRKNSISLSRRTIGIHIFGWNKIFHLVPPGRKFLGKERFREKRSWTALIVRGGWFLLFEGCLVRCPTPFISNYQMLFLANDVILTMWYSTILSC